MYSAYLYIVHTCVYASGIEDIYFSVYVVQIMDARVLVMSTLLLIVIPTGDWGTPKVPAAARSRVESRRANRYGKRPDRIQDE